MSTSVRSIARRPLPVLVLILVAAACESGTEPEPAALPAPLDQVTPEEVAGRLVFASGGGVNRSVDILTTVPGSGGFRKIETGFFYSGSPDWSPDGTRVAFVANWDAGSDVYVMDADGSNLTRVTSHPADDWSPAWSPDGRTLAFASERDGDMEIYTVGVDGTGLRRITENPARDVSPAFSPDGSRLAFHSDRDWPAAGFRKVEMYVVALDGSGVTRVTFDGTMTLGAAWSPDGSRIAFTAPTRGGESLFTMRPDGSDRFRVTESAGRDLSPEWSPDGRHLVFSRILNNLDPDVETVSDIFIVRADGTGLMRVTDTPEEDSAPDWTR